MPPSNPNPPASGAGNTQYNAIATAYTKLYPPSGEASKTFPLSILEEHQLHTSLVQDPSISIRGKHVLDFACGGGYYSSKFLAWGAASVTGVDISREMLDVARRGAKGRGVGEERMRFVEGDATDVDLRIDAPSGGGEKFDIVTGCWLLNYSADTEIMTRMWTVIGQHLKPGGFFVGLVNPPLATGKPFEGALLDALMAKSGAWGKYGQRGRCLETMPNDDGFKVRVELGFPERGDDVAAFNCYYLRNRVYEDGCNRSGLFGWLEWRDFLVPESERGGNDRPIGFWNDLVLSPHARVCVARRLNR